VFSITWVFPKLNQQEYGRLWTLRLKSIVSVDKQASEDFALVMAMGNLRKKVSLHEPEGSILGWQILLKGNSAAKALWIETQKELIWCTHV